MLPSSRLIDLAALTVGRVELGWSHRESTRAPRDPGLPEPDLRGTGGDPFSHGSSVSDSIQDGKVVIMHYTLKNDEGEVLDSSVDAEPMPYLHGADNIVPGLEAALAGADIGQRVNVTVAPADGYGERSGVPDQGVPRDQFPAEMEIEPEMQFIADADDGQMIPVWVTRVTADEVYLTTDHPLAGENLHFEVEVVALRDPTPSEVEHGHPHGLDGTEEHDH